MRTFGLNLCIGVFYCLSCIAVPWAAVLVHTWRRFLLLIAIPHASVALFYFYVPESAQWLISKGKIEEAIVCFKRIAKINRKVINPKVFESLRSYSRSHIKPSCHESVWGLLRTPNLRRKTLILVFKS